MSKTTSLRASLPNEERVDDRVTELPGYGPVDEVQFAGYASIGTATGKLFYWFVGAEDYANKPTILWTNGGPGSSSFWGFFLENGPYEIDAAGKRLSRRPQAWNQYANYLIFEHPLSVTLSAAQKPQDIPQNVEQGIAQLYQALLEFFERHPEIARKPLILAGESYGGTYLPLLARMIARGNLYKRSIDLRMLVLCDAWVAPLVQMAMDTTYAYARGLISAVQKQELDAAYANRLPGVDAAIQRLCGLYMTNIAQRADPPFDPIYTYLNDPEVRMALHVPDYVPEVKENWSPIIAANYQARVNDSYLPVVQALIDGISPIVDDALKLLVVSGLNDAKDCNFLGTGAWLERLQGDAAFAFRSATPAQWKDEHGNVLGFAQDGGQICWLKVLNAGHMAVRDQPRLVHFILDALTPTRSTR
jgi:cathepsin A (carboxypeptidase C)